jgi:SAM-dependent methyltransferase
MVKYITTAVALKGFSSSALTRSLYRNLGNRVGNRRRSSGPMPGYYPERVKRMLRLQRKHKIVGDGDRIVELGTGWLHWEALTLRLFYDIEAVLFDVWDNRQLGGLKNYVRQLGPLLSDGFGLSAAELKRARSLIEEIVKVESFPELYELLGFEYVVESSGSLAQFQSGSFQLVVSGGVLEHVKRDALPTLIRETERILKPGGWAVHSIDTADHLEHYDRKVSPKMYLSFSEGTWARLFENEVQYINRMQRGEWLELFKGNGFELIEEEARRVDISRLRLAERYVHMDKGDVECTFLRLALRRGQMSEDRGQASAVKS